ncbi:hypothetical protein NQD34_004768, partial [Periophthalmus magnuspinnatus]
SVGLTGTKLGCAEGGCGACTVMISRFHLDSQRPLHFAVNACLAPLCSLHLTAVTTTEGIGSTAQKLHPVQERISHAHGSQCGFCTPGFVMSMYALLRNNPTPHMEQLQRAFQGNLCRCTGYRPILEGFKTFIQNGGCWREGANGCCMDQGLDQDLDKDLDQDMGLSSALFDPSEFMPFDPTQEVIFPPELISLTRSRKSQSLVFRSPHCTWFQPDSLDQLLDLKWTHPESKIVVGNTEVGIEVKFKNMVYPVFISPTQVPELNSVRHTETGIRFGAAVSLDSVELVLQDAVMSLPVWQTEVFRAVLEQLRWFAGKQIRNVASLGGNIMTASPISDLNPALMSTAAKLTLRDKEGVRVLQMDQDFFTGYRQTTVHPEEVLVSAELAYSQQGQFVRSYKTSRRRDDDISIVTATFNVTFEPKSSRVHDLRLAFGGMGPTTIVALKTSNALRGRTWGEKLLQSACSSLADEMTLDPSCPGGMVLYRRTLVLSLFYKFYLTVLQSLKEQGVKEVELVPSECLSATEVFHPPAPSSVQVYQTVPSGQDLEDVVGRPLMHVSAEKQATGEAQYCDDLRPADNELYLSLICSTRAHAKVLSIDCSEAHAMPSVVSILFADDVPGSNWTGPIVHDETVLAQGEVTCVGHVIGAVVAETQADAQKAAKSIKIQYQDLPAIITIQEAIEAQSFYEPITTLQKGDLEVGFKQSDHILEGELHIGGQEHFYLETNVTVAVPRDQDEIEIFSSTQSPSQTQSCVARVLGVPSNRVHVRVKRIGGGFGGKEFRANILSNVVALAAHRLRRPVRCMLDRDEDMLMTGGRHPFYAKYKVGFSESGRVLALDVTYYSNAGNSTDLSTSVVSKAVVHMENSYLVPNIRGCGVACRTHLPSNTAFRGFGMPQAMLVCEDWISAIALKLGRTSEQIRELNLYTEGDLTPYNQVLEGVTLRRCWDECLDRAKIHERRAQIQDFNRQNRWTKKGLAVVPTKCGIAFKEVFLNQAGALVHIYTDGSVLLAHGGTEMGQGLHTKMIQVCSRALGIPVTTIHVCETSCHSVANSSATAASVSSDLYGAAVLNACNILNQRLQPYKDQDPQGNWKSWVKAAYFERVNLSTNGFYRTPGLDYDSKTNSGRMFHYFAYGVCCSVVEIDCLTGAHKTLSSTIVMDVGNSLNPAIDIGQVEGAFMQGIGLFTNEQLLYSPDGVLMTRGPGTYKIPGFGDIPTLLQVSLLRDAPNDNALYSSKAVGEPPLFLAASVFFALKDAIATARLEAGLSGPFQLDSPATAERIRMACADCFTKMCPPAEPGTYKPWAILV